MSIKAWQIIIMKEGTAGYLNTMGGVIINTLSFEYHIQGLSW